MVVVVGVGLSWAPHRAAAGKVAKATPIPPSEHPSWGQGEMEGYSMTIACSALWCLACPAHHPELPGAATLAVGSACARR